MESETVDEHLEVEESEADNELIVARDQCKSYSRETKLLTIQYYYECQNKYKRAKKFGIKISRLHGWLQNETKINGLRYLLFSVFGIHVCKRLLNSFVF